ncbi:MAG: hypothetical protein IPM39_10565 [Chloroflexi bacterium]|nr:hypothetical protein [Chloroflexota bacterium]
MSEKPTLEETANWQRRLASQANNRAWSLSESRVRTPEEDDEMLQAAHTAMYLWTAVGNEKAQAHAAQLVAHVYALLGMGSEASRYQTRSQPIFFGEGTPLWEVALAHAVAANVAAVNKDTTAHNQHYRKAIALVAALPDPEDRQILEATLNVVPLPDAFV